MERFALTSLQVHRNLAYITWRLRRGGMVGPGSYMRIIATISWSCNMAEY